MEKHSPLLPVLLGLGLIVLLGTPASAQWQVSAKDGKSNFKFGFMAQPQLEVVDTPDGTAQSQNLFLRRFRLLFSGQVSEKWTFFFETDNPNLGKANTDRTANPTGVKDTGYAYIQDAFITYNHSDAFKIDGGMILPPLGHHHGQSAATLLAVDYGAYSFPEAGPLGTRVGRDYGVQLRGYPFKQHMEYRLAVTQGQRGVEARNELRVSGRAVWYPFAAETGFFYGGTMMAAKRTVGIGASFDRQKEYRQYGADVFIDEPIKKGEQSITAQFNWMRLDGKSFLKNLPKQDTYLAEVGALLLKGKLSPFVQYARRDFDLATLADQWQWQAGVAYWMAGHQRNLKFGAGQQHTAGTRNRTLVQVQLQVFFF